MGEARTSQRAPATFDVRTKSASDGDFSEQPAHDISTGGVFLCSDSPLTPGTLLRLEFSLGEDDQPAHGVGRVVWVRAPKHASADKPAGMGIKFVRIDDESRERVDAFVKSHGPVLSDAGDVSFSSIAEPDDQAFPAASAHAPTAQEPETERLDEERTEASEPLDRPSEAGIDPEIEALPETSTHADQDGGVDGASPDQATPDQATPDQATPDQATPIASDPVGSVETAPARTTDAQPSQDGAGLKDGRGKRQRREAARAKKRAKAAQEAAQRREEHAVARVAASSRGRQSMPEPASAQSSENGRLFVILVAILVVLSGIALVTMF